jgi:hypothetical protein
MKRTHPLPSAAGAAPALAQHAASPAEPDGAGPAEMLRRAQAALRGGQTAQANELLERAETRLLTGVEPTKPGQGEPAFHASEARRALMNRDRAEAMRHTNMAIATARDGGGVGTATGADAAAGSDRRGVQGGGPGVVDSGMGTLPASATGRAVIRDSGAGGTSVSRAEGVVVLAQADTSGRRGAPTGSPPTGLPPGDTLPGWSGLRGGTGGGGTPSQQGFAPAPAPLGAPPAGTQPPLPSQNLLPSGPSSSGLTGGEPARVGGTPPGDTSRAPGSSGIGGAGVGGPLR